MDMTMFVRLCLVVCDYVWPTGVALRVPHARYSYHTPARAQHGTPERLHACPMCPQHSACTCKLACDCTAIRFGWRRVRLEITMIAYAKNMCYARFVLCRDLGAHIIFGRMMDGGLD